MDTTGATRTSDPGPIVSEWTIAQLLEWLSDDAHQHDVTLQHPLARIEALITGAHWARTPSTVALIRSIAVAVRNDPALLTTRIRDVEPRQASPMSARIPQLL
ncbi:hypothetical protein [Microbacterium oxydans]|uniref:hypothetical protein n=1 Tax=Microbacterium oxydans TaxID=82380 RepID=UPI00366FB86F